MITNRVLRIAVAVLSLAGTGALLAGCSKSTSPTSPSDDSLTWAERTWILQKGTLQVGAFNDYPPFGFVDGSGKAAGMAVDYWAVVAQRLGIKIVFTPTAFADQLAGLRAGRFDALQGIFPLEERKQWFAFSTPYFAIDTRIYVDPTHTDRTTLASLTGLTVAVVEGDSGQQIAGSAGLTTLVVRSYPDAVSAVAGGGAQAMILDQLVADYFISQASLSAKVKVVGSPVATGQMTMPVAVGNVELLRILNKGIAMVGPDAFASIYAKWMGK
jgi:polar amino acid transport system substrate-binding protein